jgi:hypothetical protein
VVHYLGFHCWKTFYAYLIKDELHVSATLSNKICNQNSHTGGSMIWKHHDIYRPNRESVVVIFKYMIVITLGE